VNTGAVFFLSCDYTNEMKEKQYPDV